jgi:hypothetical protein
MSQQKRWSLFFFSVTIHNISNETYFRLQQIVCSALQSKNIKNLYESLIIPREILLYVSTYKVVLLNDTMKACPHLCFHLLHDMLLCLNLDVHFSQSGWAHNNPLFGRSHDIISLTCGCVFFASRC